jgi:hypothetical protein
MSVACRRSPAGSANAVTADRGREFRGEEPDLQEGLDNACKWAAIRVDIRAGIDSWQR